MGFKAISNEAFEAKMEERNMTADGREIPDPRPVRPSVRVQRQKSMFDYHREAMFREQEYRRMMEQDSEDDLVDFGDDDEEMAEHLSEYERADLEVELRKAEARERASAQQKPSESGSQVAPGAGQGAKPSEAGGDQPPLTPPGAPATSSQ